MNTNHNLESFCSICNKKLIGKQKIFCSSKCKGKNVNSKHQNYKNQQNRGLFRKIQIIQMFGAKCKVCNYDKNFSCLTFHHKDPKTKKFCLLHRTVVPVPIPFCLFGRHVDFRDVSDPYLAIVDEIRQGISGYTIPLLLVWPTTDGSVRILPDVVDVARVPR